MPSPPLSFLVLSAAGGHHLTSFPFLHPHLKLKRIQRSPNAVNRHVLVRWLHRSFFTLLTLTASSSLCPFHPLLTMLDLLDCVAGMKVKFGEPYVHKGPDYQLLMRPWMCTGAYGCTVYPTLKVLAGTSSYL